MASVPPPTRAILAGRLLNVRAGDSVRVIYHRTEALSRRAIARTRVDSAGRFRLVLDGLTAATDGQYAGPAGFITVFLSPGDSVFLTANKPHFWQTLHFSGRGSAANNYLVQAHRRFDTNWDSLPEKLYGSSRPTEFQMLVEARHRQQLALLAAYPSLPTAFVQSRRLVLDFQRAVSLLRYVSRLKQTTNQEPVLPRNFWDVLASLPLAELNLRHGNLALLQATADLFEVYPSARLLPPGGVLANAAGLGEQLQAQATADFGNTPARDQIMGVMLSSQLYRFPETSRAAVRAVLPAFWAHNQDSAAARQVRRAWLTMAPLQRGSPAPLFSLLDAAGKPVALHDFRGKVVYLDFWYSSCAPCVAEAPASAQLKRHFAGRDVIFLYVSVDKRPEDWRKALTRHALMGPTSVHLLDPSGSGVAARYGVSSYPSYWIIGRDGHIWKSVAPRPSSGENIIEALEQALTNSLPVK
ncbi:TlpA family protein disulfide reductase [Hymenobacter oligotrophus]|nr:TlpA disulfide reductase family protein [Hymenobacter oligotrophus]